MIRSLTRFNLLTAVCVTIDYPAIEVATFGAVLQELVFWYDARTKLTELKYKKILRSPGYWIFGILMMVASGVGTWIWFDPDPQKPRTYLLMGAAFPILFKKLVAAFISKETKLGLTTEKEQPNVNTYFGAS
jgi:hypothetical protein